MTKHVVPDAIPYIKKSQDNLRSWEAKYHGNPLSNPTWMTGQPPMEIIAATSYVESGDDPFGVPNSPDAAIGPMQLTVGGREVQAWNRTDWTTFANVPKMDASRLADVQTNYDVGTFGLEYDHEELQATAGVPESAKRDWFATTLYYFGCLPQPDGSPDPNCGDVYNNAVSYYHGLVSFVQTNYGQEAVDSLSQGNAAGLTGPTTITSGCGITDVGCWAQKGAEAALSGLFGSLSGVAPRIGIAVLGLGIGLIGLKVLAS